MTSFWDLFASSFWVTLQLLTLFAGVLSAFAALALSLYFGFRFFQGAYWAALGRPMPPKPDKRS